MQFKKILISAPTASAKNYCLEEYLLNVSKIEYSNFKCVLFDNSNNAEHINQTMKRLFGNDDRFLAIDTDVTGLENSLIARMCKSHNQAREYAIDNGFDYLLHLESDLIIQPHFLQELLLAKKSVVGALYDRDFGRFRKLMVQQRVHRAPNNVFMKPFDQQDELYWINGEIKEVGHLGLGCLLIDVKALKKVPFRFIEGVHLHTDSYFAEDLHKAGIKIFAHTGLKCEHRNSNWILDINEKL